MSDEVAAFGRGHPSSGADHAGVGCALRTTRWAMPTLRVTQITLYRV